MVDWVRYNEEREKELERAKQDIVKLQKFAEYALDLLETTEMVSRADSDLFDEDGKKLWSEGDWYCSNSGEIILEGRLLWQVNMN